MAQLAEVFPEQSLRRVLGCGHDSEWGAGELGGTNDTLEHRIGSGHPHLFCPSRMIRNPHSARSVVARAQVAPGDLDLAVVGQLMAANFPLSYKPKASPLQMVALQAALRRRLSRRERIGTRVEEHDDPSI